MPTTSRFGQSSLTSATFSGHTSMSAVVTGWFGSISLI